LKGDFESGEGESDDNEQQASDEEALRLDTPNARIMVRTIHKAKGLEYNAVIIHKCLDVGGKSPSRNGKIIRPDLASDDNQQDDLGTSKAPRLFLKGENEGITEQEIEAITKQEIEAITKQEIEEDARLLYVAMTRAKQRLVLMRKIIVGKEYYKFPAVLDNAGFDPFLSEESLKGDLKNLVSYLSPTQLSTTQKDKREIKKSTTLEVKIIKSPRPLKRTIGSTSYTGLSHGDNTTKERPGQNDGSNDDSGSPSKTGSSFKQLLPDGLKGSLLGIFIHEVLESLDFQTSLSNPDLRNIIEAKFRQAGLLPKGHADESPAIDLITKSISLWLTQPLSSHTQIHPNAKAFSLQKIAPQKQIAEVRFAYAADLDKKIIGEIEKAFKDEFNESPLSKLTIKWDKKSAPDRQESPLKGIIIGAIDYIFEHEGRYYIIDWKTNFLGKSQASYEKAKLEESISKEKYHLQFSLYTLALDAHMKSRLGTNWNYERDFGGVYYLYLRGFGANPESDLGVFYHRPTLKFIQTLSTCLQPTPDQNL
jgi:exodeoxyribonuclease V beta subunit